MKNDSIKSHWLCSLSASVCASLLCSSAANANPDRVQVPLNRIHGDSALRANRGHHAGARIQPQHQEFVSRGPNNNRGVQKLDRDTSTLHRALGANRQINHIYKRMAHNVGISLPGQVSAFLTSNPAISQNLAGTASKSDNPATHLDLATVAPKRSTYINYEGDEKRLANGFSLDLSSTDANVTVGSNLLDGRTVTIDVGDGTKQVNAGSILTPAEYAALNQRLTDGTQGLTLNNSGAATGGALHLNLISDDGRTIKASDLVVPESVSIVGDFARAADGVRVRNDLVNSGSIYAITSNSDRKTAIIAARKIINNSSGIVTTNVPVPVADNGGNALNLALRADSTISNHGQISSSGDLELAAGESIQNIGGVEAKGNLTLNAANLTNRGMLKSIDGNVVISAPQDMHLTIENSGGAIQALSGDINVATNSLLNPKLNTTIVGGDWYSKQFNISSSDGTADAIVGDVKGTVNIKAGAAHFHADAADLSLGSMQLSGDPVFSNSGNLVLTGLGLVTNGAPLSLVAGGNITAGTATTIDTSNGAGAGGELLIAAGANFSIGGGQLLIIGGLAAGGDIDLTGVTTISTSGTTNGGDIQIVAYNPTLKANTGSIKIPTSTTITSGGGGAGTNGHVTIISESNTTGITMGGVDTRGGSGGDGSITIDAHRILINTGSIAINDTTGAIISGNFFPDIAIGSDVPISVGNLHTQGAAITVRNSIGATQTKSTISTGNLDTGAGFGPAGDTSIFVFTRCDLTVNGFITAHVVTLATLADLDLENLSSINIPTDKLGNGGFIEFDSDTLTRSKELVLNAIGTASGKGGNVHVSTGTLFGTTSTTTLGGVGSTLRIDSHGGTDGGTAEVISSGPILVNAGGINAAGLNGSGSHLQLWSLGELVTLNDLSFLSQADATGNNGDGGEIDIRGFDIAYANSLASPLALNANGIGTGNGGKVSFRSTLSETPLFVGAPVKAPKTAANFITASAKSGLLGGNGGEIYLANGNTMTVDMAALDASAQSSVGVWKGASYTLDTSLSLNTDASGLIINGSINADGVNGGDSGFVSLLMNNAKTAFSLNSGKVPKNGISGTISASGNLGSIDILNMNGGIKVLSPTALNAPTISLSATGTAQTKKSKISVKKTVITASKSLTLLGHNGIGTLSVSAPTLRLMSNLGKVTVTNVLTTPVTLLDSFGGAGFTLTTKGPTTLNDIGTNAGAIKVTGGNGGVLQVAAGSNIEAKESSLTLSNPDITNGSILIGANAKVQTSGVKGKNTIIAIGKPSSRGLNPFTGTNPPNMNVTQSGGTVFFGIDPAGVVATGPTAADINAKNANVIFNNGSTNTGANKITLQSNVDVIADPPDKVNDEDLSPTAVLSSRAMMIYETTPLAILNHEESGTDSPSSNLLKTIDVSFNDVSNSVTRFGVVDQDELTRSNLSLFSNIPSTETITDIGQIGTTDGAQHEWNSHSRLYAPDSDETIKTSFGTIELSSRCLVLVMESRGGVAVYNLDDRAKNSVIVNTQGKSISLSPGRHAHITKYRTDDFSQVNQVELIQYRGMQRIHLENVWHLFTSEFSIPSACYAVPSLKHLMASNDKKSSETKAHLIKTAAVLMTIRPDQGDFVQFFKSAATAMNMFGR